MKILTSKDDNFLYDRILKLLYDIKITQGGTALYSTLRRHTKMRDYLLAKQIEQIEYIENIYFLDDGSLNNLSIKSHNK